MATEYVKVQKGNVIKKVLKAQVSDYVAAGWKEVQAIKPAFTRL